MSDEIRELHSEINALKESVGMEEENEASKAQNSSTSTIAIPTSHPLQEEGGSSEFASNIKRPTKRCIQNWLIDSLPWIGRKEMANSSLSTSCETFRQLCWPKLHQKVKPHKIPSLQCIHNRTQFRRLDTNEIIPIASTPAPHYIDGIGRIELSFVNEQIVDFAKSIDRLLQNCDLIFRFNHEMNQTEVAPMHALLDCLANKIFKFILSGRTSLGWNDFNRLFPGILDQIQSLMLHTSLNIDDFHTLMNWLTNQSNDGKQKIIESYRKQESMEFAINHIKEKFSNSNSPSNFLIYFANFDQNFEEFTLENTRTNEVLTLYRSQDLVFYYLARYPKGEEHWKEDGQNKIQKGRALDSNIIISLL